MARQFELLWLASRHLSFNSATSRDACRVVICRAVGSQRLMCCGAVGFRIPSANRHLGLHVIYRPVLKLYLRKAIVVSA